LSHLTNSRTADDIVASSVDMGFYCWGHALVTYENNMQVRMCVACCKSGMAYLWVKDDKCTVVRQDKTTFQITFSVDSLPSDMETKKITESPPSDVGTLIMTILCICIILFVCFFEVLFGKRNGTVGDTIKRLVRNRLG
jgi:hypothetical protein